MTVCNGKKGNLMYVGQDSIVMLCKYQNKFVRQPVSSQKEKNKLFFPLPFSHTHKHTQDFFHSKSGVPCA
jgi:hypothetical protein